ncbi:hypothetical protein LRS73_31840 [Methylobacterium currus]|uniref:hypothetical protein n=1 Tax=Methylobacterium currus TaxID=2051553 RepID=UPI001E57A4C6|nr:hypothetical protein [Methylobacterium currus]UHC19450.1 hypothetical protein LRS73_31840 [Methylobacterium currus]
MSMLPAPIAERLGKLIGRLGSDHDGEVVATSRAIQRTLKSAGCDLHDLAEALTAPPSPPQIVYRERPAAGRPAPTSYRWGPSTWREGFDPNRRWQTLVARCQLAVGRLSDWETSFLVSLKGRLDRGHDLTDRQRDRLLEIATKVGVQA